MYGSAPQLNFGLVKIKTLDTKFTMRTPYAVHYYLEALYVCGLRDKMIEKIKTYWGRLLDAGYDCCPERFNRENDFESPYNENRLVKKRKCAFSRTN